MDPDIVSENILGEELHPLTYHAGYRTTTVLGLTTAMRQLEAEHEERNGHFIFLNRIEAEPDAHANEHLRHSIGDTSTDGS
jgi:hypothetical protein